MINQPQAPFEANSNKSWKALTPPPLIEIVERYMQKGGPPVVLFLPEQLDGMERGSPEHIIILQQQLNDLSSVNSSLIRLNAQLREGGYLIGCVETTQLRKKRILGGKPWPGKELFYGLNVLVRRAWSRLSFLRGWYFKPASGRSWALSEIEVLGRLCACGFYPEETLEEGGLLYFCARRVALPDRIPQAGCGPVICLPRVGKGGQLITIYKFRTMYPYSEYLQEYVFKTNGLQKGGKFKDDPRITPSGRILRKYWLDEIPNLINLLKGEIKPFGLRPISEHYLSLYPEFFRQKRQRCKPGLVPPEYVDLPKTSEEIVESESRYLEAYEQQPFLTDMKYTLKACHNILFKRVRSH